MPAPTNTGYSVDGSFAEYLRSKAAFAADSRLGFDEAAPILCAGVTTYKGLKETDAQPGDWVVISGVGGLGHVAVQYAVAMGYRVIAVDISNDKLDLARALGAEITLNANRLDPADEVQRLIGGAHGALVTAVSPLAFSQAIGMLRRGGTVSLVGLPPGSFQTPIFDVVLKRLTIRGSIVGTRADLTEALAFAARGKVKAEVAVGPLEAVNSVLEGVSRARSPAGSCCAFYQASAGSLVNGRWCRRWRKFRPSRRRRVRAARGRTAARSGSRRSRSSPHARSCRRRSATCLPPTRGSRCRRAASSLGTTTANGDQAAVEHPAVGRNVRAGVASRTGPKAFARRCGSSAPAPAPPCGRAAPRIFRDRLPSLPQIERGPARLPLSPWKSRGGGRGCPRHRAGSPRPSPSSASIGLDRRRCGFERGRPIELFALEELPFAR